MADQPPVCVHCGQAFKKRPKYRGLDKRPLSLKLRKTDSKTTVLDALKSTFLYEGTSTGHVCGACYLLLEQAYTQINGTKRKDRTPGSTPHKKKLCTKSPALIFDPLATSTPRRSRRTLFTKNKVLTPATRKRTGTLKSIKEAVAKARYMTAFKLLLARSPKAHTAFKELVRRTVQTEMKRFLSNEHQCKGPVDSVKHIDSFNWVELIEDAVSEMPTLLSAMRGSMGIKDNTISKTRKGKLAQPRMGMMLAIPLYTHRPCEYKIVQATCSAQMWRSGCSEKLFKCLNHLGICQSFSTTRDVVDKLCSEPDRQLIDLKENLENEGSLNPPDQRTRDTLADLMELAAANDDTDSDYEPESMDESLESVNTSIDSEVCASVGEPFAAKKQATNPGYAFVWDNIQKLSQCRDSHSENRNEMHLWANAFVAVNRVEPSHKLTSTNCLKAKEIPISSFLHTMDDAEVLHERCCVIVGRVLVRHMRHFTEHYSDVAVWHIPHLHSEEMSQKSTTVNIGIIDENPSTRAGTILIMRQLQESVPRLPDGTYRVAPCHGDGASVERMNDAKKARSADPTDTDRLEGLEQTPQEFHHRGLMLQDNLDLLLNGNSIGERGTLAQLRNEFNHRNATATAMHSFNDVENLLRFSTEAHVVYLALKFLNVLTLDGVPADSDPTASVADRKQYLNKLCTKIVDTVWLLPASSEVENVTDAEVQGRTTDWCFCDSEEEIDGVMVRCSNPECHLGSWFHASCVDIQHENLPDRCTDWWCSEECKGTARSILCTCKRIQEGPLVHCAAGEDCERGEVFHMDCVHLTEKPASPWYCSTVCQVSVGPEPDYQRNYTIAQTWYGLLDMAHRDMIREGDGLAMMAMWRINMTRFWSLNHYKYLIIGHRLLAGINGWLQPRLIEEILHNRTCNMRGGPGHNIPMDRVNEFLNNEFKEVLRHTHGQYTKVTVHRAGRMVGSLAKAIDDVFSVKMAGTELDNSYRKQFNYKKDIELFVTEYWNDNFFDVIPGRCHASFPQFSNDTKILHPKKLKERLQLYGKRLDKLREVLE